MFKLHTIFSPFFYNSAILSGQPKYAIRLPCPADDSEKNEYGPLRVRSLSNWG